MPQTTDIRGLLLELRGGGFNTSITVPGFQFVGQKVVAVQNNIVFTVDAAGVVRATLINQITSVDF